MSGHYGAHAAGRHDNFYGSILLLAPMLPGIMAIFSSQHPLVGITAANCHAMPKQVGIVAGILVSMPTPWASQQQIAMLCPNKWASQQEFPSLCPQHEAKEVFSPYNRHLQGKRNKK